MTEKEQREVFRANLTRIMRELNLTQADVARAVGVSPQSFNAWVHGKTVPRMGKIQALANVFHVSKADLLDNRGDGTDVERNAILQMAYDDPGKRVLFDLAARADEKETELAVQFMKALVERNK